jgi:hypothetical protein
MLKRVLFAGFVALLGGAAQADQDHAVTPDASLVPVVTREVCATTNWGFDEIRTACRTEALPPSQGNPALRGICTTYYGRRTCY